jgi:hypothetical protein
MDMPSVFGCNLQCELVRKVNIQEECHWSHACSLQAEQKHETQLPWIKRRSKSMKLNGILECKFLSKTRTMLAVTATAAVAAAAAACIAASATTLSR